MSQYQFVPAIIQALHSALTCFKWSSPQPHISHHTHPHSQAGECLAYGRKFTSHRERGRKLIPPPVQRLSRSTLQQWLRLQVLGPVVAQPLREARTGLRMNFRKGCNLPDPCGFTIQPQPGQKSCREFPARLSDFRSLAPQVSASAHEPSRVKIFGFT